MSSPQPNPLAPIGLPNWAVVDLTLPIAEDLPCHWATHQPFQVKTWNWFTDHRHPAATALARNGPYATRWMAIDEHTGTHLDAPCHFIPPEGSGLPDAGPAGSVSVERVELSQLMGGCAVIGAGATASEPHGTRAGMSPLINPEVIEAWEGQHGRLRPGEIVLLHTGWDRHYVRGEEGQRYVHDVIVTARQPGWPAPSVAAIELLLDRGVRCVGIDAPSMGPAHDGRPTHVAALRTGAVFVECLTGLSKLPARGAWFCFLPLNVEGGTGAPGRAVGFLPPSG
ncbi:cyclase family protein [Micromonospora sp. Llam7]|uniref:cyclase family protein n=1 Tax=Micromonospora tarapacensis TaxID=2835305 RepID=UPI001C82D5A5|nr:cyclase family protein [Micromonospora tarapacensis]